MVPEQAREIVSAVFESWAGPLLRYAVCYTRNRAVAEELVQESFLALYHKLASGTDIENPRAWTLAVVRHLVCKHHRDASREAANLESYQPQAAQPQGIEAQLGALESLRAALELLSEREQEVLLLRIESMRYGEIAKELDITPGTVATLLSRATMKIRNMLDGNRAKVTAAGKRGTLERRSLQ